MTDFWNEEWSVPAAHEVFAVAKMKFASQIMDRLRLWPIVIAPQKLIVNSLSRLRATAPSKREPDKESHRFPKNSRNHWQHGRGKSKWRNEVCLRHMKFLHSQKWSLLRKLRIGSAYDRFLKWRMKCACGTWSFCCRKNEACFAN